MADVKWKISGALLLLCFFAQGVSAGKTLKCTKGLVDVGCSCVDAEQARKESTSWQKIDKKYAMTAIYEYKENMKKYTRAWEKYSAYMRVSVTCKGTWRKFFKAYQQWKVLLKNSRHYIRHCDGLRAGLLRTIRYKKRFLSRIKFQNLWLKQNKKFMSNLSDNINGVKDYINDSCRFMHTLWVHEKTVAWTHTLEAKKKLIRLRLMLGPLLKTLAKQSKQYHSQCDAATLKNKWKVYRKAKAWTKKSKEAAARFKRCTNRAMHYAQIEVQSKMLFLRQQANQSKIVYLRYLHKIALDKFNVCVANYGLSKCDKSKLLYVKYDNSRKIFKKLTQSLYNEYQTKEEYYFKNLNKRWRELRQKEGF